MKKSLEVGKILHEIEQERKAREAELQSAESADLETEDQSSAETPDQPN